MHPITVKIIIDFGFDWYWPSISFLISQCIPNWVFCIYLVKLSLVFFSETIAGFQVTPSIWGDLKTCRGREPIHGAAIGTASAISSFTVRPFHGATILGVALEEDLLELGLVWYCGVQCIYCLVLHTDFGSRGISVFNVAFVEDA